MSNLSTASKNQYELYLRSIMDLAQSITIKFEALATGVNSAVLLKTGYLPDPQDRASWKYFQNICGQYHFSDTPMTVFSLDTEQSIDFTVQSLQSNPVTRQAYAFGSTYYNQLLAQYPDQEMLILGILYPADMQTALSAKDGTILSYPTHLVEEAEVDLIGNLQNWIYAYFGQWYNFSFQITNDLYVASFFSQLVMNLIGAITNLRLAACKTNQAHSFHIKQYLRSHGFLDAYLAQMTRKQVLAMYRNINYYERNAGSQQTFEQLVDVVFSEASLPVYAYEMLHNEESMRHTGPTDNDLLLPVARFQRKPLNAIAKAFPRDTISLEQVFAASATQTQYTDAYQDQNADQIAKSLARSASAQLPTKIIECSINPTNQTSTQTPESILFNHWIDWVSQSRFAVPVEFIPEDSDIPVRLTHQQAVAVWVYATHMAMQPQDDANYPQLQRVPAIQISRCVRDEVVSFDELRKVIDPNYVTQEQLQLVRQTAVDIPDQIQSLIQFRQVCAQIYQSSINQHVLYSVQQHPITRASLQAATTRLYADKVVRLDDLADPDDPSLGIEYASLLQQIGLNFSGYRQVDFYNTSLRILSEATGADEVALADPANIQGAMINLMRYLSSYSIQIVASGGSSRRIVVTRPDIRFYNYRSMLKSRRVVDAGFAQILRISNLPRRVIPGTMFRLISRGGLRSSVGHKFSLNMRLIAPQGFKLGTSSRYRVRTGLSATYAGTTAGSFSSLNMEQRMSIVDIYSA